jgi:hypothetical protein
VGSFSSMDVYPSDMQATVASLAPQLKRHLTCIGTSVVRWCSCLISRAVLLDKPVKMTRYRAAWY